MSLVKLAQIGNLPFHQYMDQATLDWIVSNKPKFLANATSYNISGDDINFLKKYIPPINWFLEQKEIDTIHGLRHLLRVAIYAVALCNKERLSTKKINAVISAILHDIRRLNDKEDIGHGERAAHWLLDNVASVEQQFKVILSNKDRNEIYNAIALHEISYAVVQKENSYSQYKYVIDILKTADALDRYCQPKLKWWPNEKYLILTPSDNIKKMAYNLMVSSESLHLKGVNNIESVFQAFKQL